MQLKSLKVFCDIIRLGSFSKAAELNGVSQPSASQLVHQLEDRLGAALIDRSRRPFVVTDEGKLYYEGCRDLVRRYEELERLVQQRSRSPEGRLRVAAIYSVGLGQMHSVLEDFREAHPGVDLHVDYMHPEGLRASVISGESELGITSYPEGDKQLSVMHWRDEAFSLAVSPNHPLASIGTIAVDTLAGEKLVMPQEGLRVRDEIDRWLASHRVKVQVTAEFDNLEFIKRAIEVDEGIGLLPARTFAAEVAAGALVRVDLIDSKGSADTFVRRLGVFHRRGEDLSENAAHFLELLKSHADDAPYPLPNATVV